MAQIKCTCNDPKCDTQIQIDESGGTLTVIGKDGSSHLLYMDENEIGKFIRSLKSMLLTGYYSGAAQ